MADVSLSAQERAIVAMLIGLTTDDEILAGRFLAASRSGLLPDALRAAARILLQRLATNAQDAQTQAAAVATRLTNLAQRLA